MPRAPPDFRNPAIRADPPPPPPGLGESKSSERRRPARIHSRRGRITNERVLTVPEEGDVVDLEQVGGSPFLFLRFGIGPLGLLPRLFDGVGHRVLLLVVSVRLRVLPFIVFSLCVQPATIRLFLLLFLLLLLLLLLLVTLLIFWCIDIV